MKIRVLLSTALAIAFLAGCNDDDKPKLKNAYSYDGKQKKIKFAYVETEDLAEGNYSLIFASDEDEDYIEIQISGEWDGQKVDLSEVDDDFDWSWYVYFEKKDGEDWESVLEGFGVSEEDFGDVESGQLYIELIDADDRIFDVKLSLTTTDNKKFKLNYKGEFQVSSSEELRKKKQ